MLAERGTDTLSLKIDSSARQLKIITGAAVRIGHVEPEVMTIVRDDPAVVVVQITNTDADVFVIRLDRKTGNAVWTRPEACCSPDSSAGRTTSNVG